MYSQNLAASDRLDAAIAMTELNFELFPDSSFTVALLGGLYSAAGQTDSAIRYYTRAVELNPRAARRIGPKIEALTSGH